MSPEAMTLGVFGAVGLIGFAVVYGLVLEHGPQPPMAPQAAFQAPAQPQLQPSSQARPTAVVPPQPSGRTSAKDEAGVRGERGPAGPPGDPGIRIVHQDCDMPTCTVRCADDEVMLTAHCGAERMPAVYPTERTAFCRTLNAGRIGAVGACVKLSPH
jgi:hypothetical protein